MRGSRPATRPRAVAATLALAALALLTAGCSFLADEFTWLDAAGPVAEDAQRSLREAPVDRP